MLYYMNIEDNDFDLDIITKEDYEVISETEKSIKYRDVNYGRTYQRRKESYGQVLGSSKQDVLDLYIQDREKRRVKLEKQLRNTLEQIKAAQNM